jgi:hypothetical protein
VRSKTLNGSFAKLLVDLAQSCRQQSLSFFVVEHAVSFAGLPALLNLHLFFA